MVSPSPNYRAAQESALGFEPAEEIYRLGGAEAPSFLNAYVTQNIQTLGTDRWAPAAFLTQKGKLVSAVQVLRLPEAFLLLFPRGFGAKVESHLATFLLFAQAELTPDSANWAHFALLGPQAGALLERTLGTELPTEIGTMLRRRYEGSEALLFPSRRFGVPGWEILLPASAGAAWRRAFSEWRSMGLMEEANPETLEALRIEAGLPAMGRDMGEENLVAEVGLDLSATSFNKGCYLGQETTARVQSRGHVNRKLGTLRLADMPHALPAELFQGGKKVGSLSSAVASPKYEAPIGLALVALAAWEKPEPIFVKDGEREIPIERLP